MPIDRDRLNRIGDVLAATIALFQTILQAAAEELRALRGRRQDDDEPEPPTRRDRPRSRV